MTVTQEERKEWREHFEELASPSTNGTNGAGDANGSLADKSALGTLALGSLQEALSKCGFRLPAWRVRDIVDRMDRGHGRLSIEEFEKICEDLKSREVSSTFKKSVSRKDNLETLGGTSEASSEGTTHSVRHEEQAAFSDWINTNLTSDNDLGHLLPLSADGKDLYNKVTDGILLSKIINHSCPDTIDERAVNKKPTTVYAKVENLTLALNSARSIGCNVVNIDAHDLMKGKQHLVLGLLWQIIRLGLFKQITLEQCPGLANLLSEGDKLEDLMKLSPEAILLKWVNHQLEKSGVPRRIANFTSDIKDSEAYTHLLYQIAPLELGVTKEALMESDMSSRAEIMLQQADKLGCRSFISPSDVVEGVYKLNLAFVANLFNNHPAMDASNLPNLEDYVNVEESREERTYRNWMNSLGVSPYVNWLYSDLADGLIIFQLYEIITPGTVQWNKVHRKFNRMRKFMEKLENCNYAVDLGRKQKYSLVGIAGQDLCDGNTTLTMALVWQLMRSYTLSVLSTLTQSSKSEVEQEIFVWVNQKLEDAGKETRVNSFQDSKIATALPVIDLIDAIKPGVINYEVLQEGGNYEEDLANAKYALSMARRIGARVYALPEDIVEVKPKMVMTVFACLMAKDFVPNMDSRKSSTVSTSSVNLRKDSSTSSMHQNSNISSAVAATMERLQANSNNS